MNLPIISSLQIMKVFKRVILAMVFAVAAFVQDGNAQSVIDPADPVITYNPAAPPATPANGTIAKWIRTKRLSWNTDSWKAYYLSGVPFRIKFPASYNHTANDGKRYPAVLFLHGIGERGTIYDNEWSMANGGVAFNNATNNGSFDGFIIIPQSAGGWGTNHFAIIRQLLDYMITNNKLDPFATSVNGLSAGGGACWEMMINYPTYIATCLPMSGVSLAHGSTANIQKYKYTPIWHFQGGKDSNPDPNTTNEVATAIAALGGQFKNTLYPTLGHGTWNAAWAEPDFFPACRRAYSANPWTLFGRTEFCPGDPINVTVGVVAGMTAYEWRKDGVLIPGATSNSINVTQLGVYSARVQKNGIWSDWSRIPVEIKIKVATVTPPIATESLMSRVLPALDGSTSVTLMVPTGYASYEWRRVGNNTSIGTANTLVVTTPGEYIARVTEQYGCSSSFSDPFAVVDANGANKPSPASNVVATTTSKTTIRLDWSDNPAPQYNETNYEIYQGTSTGGPYTLLAITGADATTYNVTGLTPKTKYYYKLRAINGFAASAASNEASATTESDTQLPTAPGNLQVTGITRTSVSLTWAESVDDIAVTRYDVYIDGVRAYPATGTSITINELTPQQSYNFTVRALDGAGNQSPFSNQVTAQPRINGIAYKHYTYTGTWNNLPDFNSLTPVTTGVMTNFALTPRVQNDNFAFLWEGYIVIPTSGTYYFRTNSDDGSRLWLGSLNGSTSPYSFSGAPTVNNDGLHGGQDRTSAALSLTAGVYPIAVAFYEQGGGEGLTVSWRTPSSGTSFGAIPNSAFQEAAANNGSAPAVPSNLAASVVSYKAVNVSWTDNSNNETGFEVWRSTNATSGYAPVGLAPANTTTFTDSVALNPATTYYYQLRAVGQYGESAFIPQNDAEANWKFNNNYTDAGLNGKTLTANSSPTFNAGDKMEGTHAVDLNGSSQDLTVNTSAGDYLRGGYSQKSVAFWMKSDVSNSNRGVFDFGGSDDGLAIRLNANTLIAGIASNNARSSLTVAYNSTAWNHIALVYSTNTLRLYVNGVQVASTTSLTFTSVGTTTDGSMIGDDNGANALNTAFGQFDGKFDNFYIFDRALTGTEVTQLFNSTYGTVSATTLALPATPAIPTGLVATSASTSSTQVSWTDNATNETGYHVYRSVNDNANFVQLATLSANSNSYTDADLFANVIYYYKILATGVGSNSAFSNEDSAKTLNNIPVIAAINNQAIHYQSTVALNIAATDTDPGYLTLTVDNLPAFASFQQTASGAGTITFTQPGAQGSFPNIIVHVTDVDGGTSSESFDLTVNDNYNPTVNAISNYAVDENGSVSINLTAQDQNLADVLSWSVTNLPNAYTLTPGANGSATLLLQPNFAAAGVYTVNVSVTDGNGGTGTAQFQLTVNDKDPNKKIYARVQYANVMGAPWNNMTGITTNNLKDADNNTTSVGINFLQSWWLPYNAGPTTGNNSGVYPDGVLNDFWYFGYYGGPETASLNVTGLDPNKKYNLSFYAGSVFNYVTDNGTTNYTVGGQTVSLYVQNNTQNTVSINEIIPAANGTITVNMSKAPGTPIGYLNALVITEVYDDGTAPAMPKSLTAQVITGQGVRLNWQDAAYNETGYEVYRAVNEAGPYSLVGTTNPNTVTYLDNTISGNTQYYYKLRAFNSYGNSDYTDAVTVTTANRVPALTAIPDVQMKNNQSATVNITALDDATDQVTLTVTGLPSFATFTDNGNGTGVISINPNAGTLGIFPGVTVTAKDNNDASSTVNFTIFVTDADVTYTYVNIANDNNQAPKPWNNLNAPAPFAGLSITNLRDDNDLATGINITLTDAWQGGSSTGVRFRDGKELYPEQVSRSGIYFTDAGTRRVTVTGLNNARKYNFVFFNSHGTSESSLTNFTINGNTVSLNGDYNADKTVQINGVTPVNGIVTINVAKGAGAVTAVFSALVIQSYVPASVTVLSPVELRAVDLKNNSITLQWQDRADNETGYEIWRASAGGSYSLLTTVPANTTSYINSNLPANTTYDYTVRATYAGGTSGYSNAARGYTYSSLVHINFNTSAAVAPSPWNNLNWVYGIGASWDNFKNQSGIPTNIGMTQPVKVDGVVNSGVNTGNNSGIFPDNVMIENFGMFPGTPTYVKLSGLSSAKTYDLTFFCSVTGVFGDQTCYYTVNGKTVLLNGFNNRSGTVTLYNVSGDENGEAIVNFGSYESATFGLLGAMIVKGYTKSDNDIAATPGNLGGRGPVTTGTITQSTPVAPATAAKEEVKAELVKEEVISDTKVLGAYPNPFEQSFTLVIPASANETVQISIYDLSGKQVYQKQIAGLNNGDNYIRIDGNIGMARGTYIAQVFYVQSGKSKSLKLTKR